MAIQIQGNFGAIMEVDGTTYRALRVNARPADYGLLGSYQCTALSGTMAAGMTAYASAWQCRWTQSPQLAVIWGVSISGLAGGATPFVVGYGYVSIVIQRSWTVDGSGGNTLVLTGNGNKLRVSMASSLMTIRIATTNALTLGTSTHDSQGAGQVVFSVGTTPSVNYIQGQFGLYGSTSMEDGGNPAPIVLSQNEGLNMPIAMPGSGTWGFGVTMHWSEVSSY